MNMLLRPPLLTPEEFELLPDTQGYELIDGSLREKGMGIESSGIQCELIYLLMNWVRGARLGKVYESECMYRCFPRSPRRVRKPDVSFVRVDRLSGGQSQQGMFTIRPDFAAEVISPNDCVYDVVDKLADFESAGIPLVWVLYPNVRRVQVRTADGVVREFGEADELTGDPVLPGFRVRVGDLFPPPAVPAANVAEGSP